VVAATPAIETFELSKTYGKDVRALVALDLRRYRSGQAQRTHGRFCAGVNHPDHIHRRISFEYLLS
jgi:hypothetical protein